MLLWTAAFAMGIGVSQWLSRLPHLGIGVGIIFVSILLWSIVPDAQKNKVLVWVAFSSGLMWVTYRAEYVLAWQIPKPFIHRAVVVEGRIVSLPQWTDFGVRFDVELRRFQGKSLTHRVRLMWYDSYPALAVGDVWRFVVKLKPPHGLQNPGSWDYERQLWMEGIHATGYVVNKAHPPPLLLHHAPWHFPVAHLREILRQGIHNSKVDPALQAIITALTIGLQQDLNAEQRAVFQRTGTSHLMAISGSHVTLVSAVIYLMSMLLWRLFPRGLLRVPAPRVGAIAAMVGAIFYGGLSGFSLPTQRAVIMVCVVMVGSLFHRPIPMRYRLAWALWVVMLWQPFSLFSASFWLSFAAVMWIGWGMAGRLQRPRGFHEWWRLQWVVSLGLAPLTLFFFNGVSVVTWIANLIAIPWIEMIIVPLCLLASAGYGLFSGLGQGLFWLAAQLLYPLWWGLQWLAHWPPVLWHHSLSMGLILITSEVAVLLWLTPKGWPARWLGFIWLLPLFYYRPAVPSYGAVDLTLLDVGQGLAAVVQTAHHTLLYDTGPRWKQFDTGQSVVVPYLQWRHIRCLDLLVISHGDNDHRGGARTVLTEIPVKTVLTSIQPDRFLRHYSVEHCYVGQHWRWDGVDFRMLSPARDMVYQGNNSSCVLRISSGGHTLLLTGDIEAVQEEWLIRKAPHLLRADLVVAPHHGSRTSSSMDFVQAVGAKAVLFPVGYYNRYGFPAAGVVRRYESLGARLLTTAQDGAIQVHIPVHGKMAIKTMRDQKHYWQQSL